VNIVGLDGLVFGVSDLDACARYLTDFGLKPVVATAAGGRFEALDGTGVLIRGADDVSLPPSLGPSTMLRKTIYGVAEAATLEAIESELRKDREVRRLADGSIESVDDMGFVLGFQVSVRRVLDLPGERVNAPGAPPQRPANVVAADEDAVIAPRTLSHVVYFVPDVAKAERFYTERLGFRCTDRFVGVGPFLRPAGTLEHHCLFMIQTPAFMKGCEHFTFHLGGPTELLQAGTRFMKRGYDTFWGPGRHKLGSNWFWYFNSPLKCHVEYDADMDLHDDLWVARDVAMSADTSQLFLFTQRERWAPSGPSPQPKPA